MKKRRNGGIAAIVDKKKDEAAGRVQIKISRHVQAMVVCEGESHAWSGVAILKQEGGVRDGAELRFIGPTHTEWNAASADAHTAWSALQEVVVNDAAPLDPAPAGAGEALARCKVDMSQFASVKGPGKRAWWVSLRSSRQLSGLAAVVLCVIARIEDDSTVAEQEI